MSSLSSRVALVTGVSRRQGIGYAIARRLAGMGAALFLQAFPAYDAAQHASGDPAEAEAILETLRALGGAVEMVSEDFMEPDAPARTVQTAAQHFGHLDILVLNHTYSTSQPLDALTADEIDRHLLVNVRAALLLVREFARQHDGRAGGRIILMTSGQQLGPMPDELAYAASKGALHALTWSLSDLLIDRGITVNAVNPGPTLTWAPDQATHDHVLARMPLGRWGAPEDAARLVGWLASDEAAWITGQVINSEGGFRRG